MNFRDFPIEELAKIPGPITLTLPDGRRIQTFLPLETLHTYFAFCYNHYVASGALRLLEDSIQFCLAAVRSITPGDTDLPTILDGPSFAYFARYKRLNEPPDLDKAIKYQEAAISCTNPETKQELAVRHTRVAVSYLDRFIRFADLNDLHHAVEHHATSIRATPLGDPELSNRLWDLAARHDVLHHRRGHASDLRNALRFYHASIEGSLPHLPMLVNRCQTLAMTYRDLFIEGGDVTALRTAMHYHRRTVVLSPLGTPQLPSRLDDLGHIYRDRYRRFGNLTDLYIAIKFGLAAINAAMPGTMDLTNVQQNLAVSYRDRFARLGDIEDLQNIMLHSQAALIGTPPLHPQLGRRLQTMATAYRDRYKKLGDLNDLESALDYDNRAVNSTPPNHPDLAGRQQNLVTTYWERYLRLSDVSDLRNALRVAKSALTNTPIGHPAKSGRQQNLALLYIDLYQELKDPDACELAMKHSRDALLGTQPGHPDQPRRQQVFALACELKYNETGNLEDLNLAITHCQDAVDNTPPGHADGARRKATLAVLYRNRYIRERDKMDLDKALRYGTETVEETSKDDVIYASMLSQLAHSLTAVFELKGDPSAWDEAVSLLRRAAEAPSAPPRAVWHAAKFLSGTLKKGIARSPDTVLAIYTAAFAVLPDLLWIGNALRTRHDLIPTHAVVQVTSAAAAAALELNNAPKAVEFLEGGLSITHKQGLELSSHDVVLHATLPTQANSLERLSRQLQLMQNNQSDLLDNPHLITIQRKQLIQEIRQHEHFHDFLLPPSWRHLSKAAENGPIIILNSARSRSDAILVLHPTKEPVSIALEGVSPTKLRGMAEKLKAALNNYSIRSREQRESQNRHGRLQVPTAPNPEKMMQEVVSWLWNAVVDPVFGALKLHGIEGGRIWWCPSAEFTDLPIHAAAPADSGFIQSYTFTLEALVRARQQHHEHRQLQLQLSSRHRTPKTSEKMTAVGVTSLPRMRTSPPLPSVAAEMACISAELSTVSDAMELTLLTDAQATVANVLAGLLASEWVHFACHGLQDPIEPLNSGLELYDGRLTLAELMKATRNASTTAGGGTNSQPAPLRKFAFLSACETATGDVRLTNEAMHLAGGFVANGFLSAIGTLWSIPDAYGPQIARVVYRRMFNGQRPAAPLVQSQSFPLEKGDGANYGPSSTSPDVTAAAEALQCAISELRHKGAPLHQWMPFIHIGI